MTDGLHTNHRRETFHANYGDSALNIVRCPAIVLTDRFPIGTVLARVWLHRESADDNTGYTATACEYEPDQLSALSP